MGEVGVESENANNDDDDDDEAGTTQRREREKREKFSFIERVRPHNCLSTRDAPHKMTWASFSMSAHH
jgi:hypothetical protein